MKTTIRLAALIFVTILLLVLPAIAADVVDSGQCNSHISWILDSDGLLTITGNGEMPPYDNFVKKWNRDKIISVKIEHGITSIGEYALGYCKNLKSVQFSNSILSLEKAAFSWSIQLETLTLPDGLVTISDYAFADCFGLKSIQIPESVIQLGDCVFFNCGNIMEINIPKNLNSIGKEAFYGCHSISAVYVDDDNKVYSSVDGVMFSIDGSTLLLYPSNKADEIYTIPQNTKVIGELAFTDVSHLKSVIISDSVTDIRKQAFKNCVFSKIEIPESVINVAEDAFSFCQNLSRIDVDNNNPNYSSIDGVLFSKNRETLYNYPICRDEVYYDIPDSVTKIESFAFYHCNGLKTVDLPEGLRSIGQYAFGFCGGVSSIEIPETVIYIGDGAFTACNFKYISLPPNILEIANETFAYCYKLTEIDIPPNVKRIGDFAFHDCRQLRQISIPLDIVEIGEQAFSFCSQIIEITIPSQVKIIESKSFYECRGLETVNFECGLEVIGEYAFGYCMSLKSVILPDSVKIIESDAFHFCEKMTELKLSNSLISIGNTAFMACESIKTVRIPASVTHLGEYSFTLCEQLHSVFFEGDVPMEWGKGAFNANASDFTIYYYEGSSGWLSPLWRDPLGWSDYRAVMLEIQTEDSPILGDINFDGTVDIRDAQLLFQYSMLPDLYPIDYSGNVDFNGDGMIDIRDAQRLFQYSMLPDIYPIS